MPGSDDNTCGAAFLNGEGKQVANSNRFIPENDGVPARVSADGIHFGLLNTKLQRTTPEKYTSMHALGDGLVAVSTGNAMGVVNTRGKTIIPVGRCMGVFFRGGDLFLIAFNQGSPKCGLYVKRDGTPVSLPAGTCVGPPVGNTTKLGYAFISNGHASGAINAEGKIVIPMKYGGLGPISPQLIAFTPNVGGKNIGALNICGRVVLEPKYHGVVEGPGDTLALRTDAGWGLATTSGQWLTKPRFQEIETLGPDLAALKVPGQGNHEGRYLLCNAQGKLLGLTSLYRPKAVKGPNGVTAWKIYEPTPNSSKSTAVLVSSDGKVLVPAKYPDADFVYLGHGLWGVSTEASVTPNVIAVYGANGQPVSGLAPFHNIQPFENDVTTAMTHGGNAVLINTSGKVLASFDALFPMYGTASAGGDPLVEQTLNRCVVADPTVEPKHIDPATRRICADPKLESLSRTTELDYYSAQAGRCLPDVFLKLRPAYDKALDARTTDGRLQRTMRDFQNTVAETAKSCAAGEGWRRLKAPVDPKEQAAIKAFLRKADKEFAENEKYALENNSSNTNASGKNDWASFSRVKLGKLSAVLIYGYSGSANGPFWLVTRDAKTGWRILLSGDTNDGPTAVGGLHNRLPIIEVQGRASCCEVDIAYYQYDGSRYRQRNTCSGLFAVEGKNDVAISLCGGPDASSAGSSSDGGSGERQ